MACSIAISSGSPVFSPSRIHPFSCKASPESLTLALGYLSGSDGSAPSTSSPSSSSPPLTSSSSPFRSRFQKEASVVRVSKKEGGCVFGATVDDSTGKSTALKRKRPSRIDIPQMDSLSFEKEEARRAGVETVEVDTTRFSIFCKKGRVREQMEDRYSAAVDIAGDPRMAFFGVFDGHGGTQVADFVAKNIEKNVVGEFSKIGKLEGNEIEEAVKTGYLRTDSELLREEVAGGSCAVTALIRNDELIVSNAGDCRAVMSRSGTAEALTSDHRPSREDERNRIECDGGYVDCRRGVWRLQGSLAVSRGMGDAHLKQWVIAEPETRILRISPECEFLILASDGLWDKVSNQEAVDIARPLCLPDSNESSLLSACKTLADLSISRGSFDDISVMIIQLKHFL